MNRNHKNNRLGTAGMDYNKHPAIIETCIPQPMPSIAPQIPQSPHHQTSQLIHSYPSYSNKKIPKSKRFQKD